jgi:hypothetical protein
MKTTASTVLIELVRQWLWRCPRESIRMPGLELCIADPVSDRVRDPPTRIRLVRHRLALGLRWTRRRRTGAQAAQAAGLGPRQRTRRELLDAKTS